MIIVALNTFIGHYFPAMNPSAAVATVGAGFATKHLSRFNWLGSILALIFIAGTVREGATFSTGFVLGRAIFTVIIAYFVAYIDLRGSHD